MAAPTVVEISHTLGREEAKRRLASRLGDVPSLVPGGVAEVKSTWVGEYRLALAISALAQQIAATLDIEDRIVRVTMELPGMLGFFSGAIAEAVREQGGRLLLPDH